MTFHVEAGPGLAAPAHRHGRGRRFRRPAIQRATLGPIQRASLGPIRRASLGAIRRAPARRSPRRIARLAAGVAVMASLIGGWGGGALPAAARAGHVTAAPPAPRLLQGSDAMTASSFTHVAVAATATPDGHGFWVAYADGSVVAEGDARWLGDMSGEAMNAPVVAIAATPDGGGYWLLGADGGVFSFGDATFYGSTGGMRLNAPALQMQATPTGGGYRFVAADGGVFDFGDAAFYGSTGEMRLNAPVVGMATTAGGGGYWLVARDGGVFSFGDAPFLGSTGDMRLNAPVVGMATTAGGGGYWLVARDGGVFTFGDAGFYGSGAGQTGGASAVGLIATADGGGYWMPLSDGRVLSFGDAPAMTSPAPAATVAATQPPYDSQYSYEVTNGAGVPVRWNPCDVIDYSVMDAGAPPGWQGDVADAIAQASSATGLDFVDEGAYPSAGAVPSDTKITIMWSPSITGGDVVGLTDYFYYLDAPYNPQMVAARITLLSSLHGGFSGTYAEGPVLLHELGHSLGLGHVPGDPEVMNPVDQGFATYQPGDLNGLWNLGVTDGCSGFYD